MVNLPVIITQAVIEDAAEVLSLQKLAYQSEADIYQDYSIPPLIQTLAEIKAEFDSRLFLKVTTAGRIIGSVRAYLQDETGYIGRLIVHPDFQNRGIGTKLMQAIEQQFPLAKRYELFTGGRSEGNLYLYQKLGYKIFRRERVTERLELVFLEKQVTLG